MNELQIFNNEEFGQVRTVVIDNEPYFVGKDVAAALAYKDTSDALKRHVEAEDKLTRCFTDSGQRRNMLIINESGLYALVFGSKLETAKKFKRWVTSDVLPTLRKTGSYEMPKQKDKSQSERLASVNNAVKILTPLLEKAGCNSKIQLLTAKQLYAKAEVFLPVEIESDKRYWDTVHIARQAGICYKSSGKPADKAVNEIIRRIGITEADYTDTWESKGKWQGTVRKYSDEVIERVICWIADNDYPVDIEYKQTDGQVKAYHVSYKNREVA